MTVGLVIGKFLPYHQGHHNLIQFASEQCDDLYVLVGDSDKFSIPAWKRQMWIEEDFPDAIVKKIPEEPISTDNREWAWRTRFALGFSPDVVFSSEDYGEEYAAMMGATHVMYDRERIGVPCQGHLILEDLWGNFKYLSAPAKAHFAKRVVIVGAESTGKTTLTRELAKVYDTVWTPEYGRMYADGKIPTLGLFEKRSWRPSEFDHISKMQKQMEHMLAHDANRVIFSDTDSLCTELWHERYVGYMDINLHYEVPHLYILADTDIPLEQDGTREESLDKRSRMQKRFLNTLIKNRFPFITASGTLDERINTCMQAISKLFT